MKCSFSIPLVLLSLVPHKAASFDRVPLYCYHISQNTGWVCTTPELWVLCHHLTLGLIFLCSAPYPTFSAPDTFSSFPTKGPAFLSTQGFSWRLFPHCFLPSSLLPILPSKVRRHVATFLTPMSSLDDLFLVNPHSFSFIVLKMLGQCIFIHIVSDQ